MTQKLVDVVCRIRTPDDGSLTDGAHFGVTLVPRSREPPLKAGVSGRRLFRLER